MNQFEALGLSPNVLYSIEALGYDVPTPIQVSAIPHVLAGRDIMGLAQTGTGKTAAFGLPLVQRLLDEKTRAEPRCVRALILAPTRELANQIGDNMRGFVKRTPLRIVTVVGGASINSQTRNLEKGADILIATPGRLLDLSERRAVRIDSAKYLVLDEADQMLDLGFIHALRKIASMLGAPRQTMLFSATMPKSIEQLSRAFLVDPVRVETAVSGKPAENVTQFVHFVAQSQKAGLLKELLLRDPAHLSLVFARTKHGTEKLMKSLVAAGIDAVSIHGNKSQSQRERAIREFRDGDVRVLVATDVAARGIDVPGVSHVYNHDLPEVPEAYVHRIGRTARAGASGEAVSLCAPDENHLLRAVEKLTGIVIQRLNAPAPRQPRVAAISDVTEGKPAAVEAAPEDGDFEPRREYRGNGQRNGNRNGGGGNGGGGNGQRNGQRNGGNRNGGQHAGRSEGEPRRFGGAPAPRDGGNRHSPEAGKRNGPRKDRGQQGGDARFEGRGEHRPRDAEAAHQRVSEGNYQRRGEARTEGHTGGRPHSGKPSGQGAVKFGGPSSAANGNGGKPAHANANGKPANAKPAHAHGKPRQGDARPARSNHKQNRRPGRAAAF